MAKRKSDLNNIFADTEVPKSGITAHQKPDADALAVGKIRSVGVGLKDGEIAALNEIAATVGVSRNALMRFALRYFIKQHRAGAVDVPTKKTTSTNIDMP